MTVEVDLDDGVAIFGIVEGNDSGIIGAASRNVIDEAWVGDGVVVGEVVPGGEGTGAVATGGVGTIVGDSVGTVPGVNGARSASGVD